ncbi:MAG TPA: tyrosine/phenylalanine carboxypeptidase domain-containing protein, partial [Polyangiales bacterium]|nr:tyrosine/phenylalanine carboxypeptidase domain-containing protein [Polyangiales bacterium]
MNGRDLQPAVPSSELAAARAFEDKLALVARGVRLLPNLTARNAAAERMRLQEQLELGDMPLPRFEYAAARPTRDQLRFLDKLRVLALHVPGSALYLAKLEELELDLALLASLGDRRRVRPLAARRFGRGDQRVETPDGSVRLIDYARRLLRARPRREECTDMPPDAEDGAPSLRALVERVAAAAGLDVSVRVEPNLTAGAATGDRTVYLADRRFGPREALRLAVHEVLGHLTSAANGRAQPLRILEWGTGFAFADQEGVALCVEAAFGLLDRGRLRSLAGRVLATESMHEGAS